MESGNGYPVQGEAGVLLANPQQRSRRIRTERREVQALAVKKAHAIVLYVPVPQTDDRWMRRESKADGRSIVRELGK